MHLVFAVVYFYMGRKIIKIPNSKIRKLKERNLCESDAENVCNLIPGSL